MSLGEGTQGLVLKLTGVRLPDYCILSYHFLLTNPDPALVLVQAGLFSSAARNERFPTCTC